MVDGGWLAGLLAFLGAAIGAGGAYAAAQRGTRQRQRQGEHEKWGRRFTTALEAMASDTFRRRALGREVLVHVSRSRLATAEDRGLADAVLAAAARLDTEGDDLVDLFRGVSVDDVLVVEDDDQEQDEEGSR